MRPRLLVVDDEAYNRDLVERTFARIADVTVVARVDEAIAACEAAGFDVVVTDQRLVGGLGSELAAVIRARWPATRIVIITGFAEDAEVVAAGAAGLVDDVIGKPWTAAALRSRVLARAS